MREDDRSGTIGHRHQALRDQVLEEIRRRIVEGRYPPGARLTEERLAADFGVSRNPVREALRVVETEGFVTMTPRRGAVVTTPNAETIGDLFAIRGGLEATAARLAAERATPKDVAALRGLLEAARIATEEEDLGRVAQLNNELHKLCIAITGNRWLIQMSSALYLHVHWVFRIGAAERAPHSWAEHIRIVDAIEAHDPQAAEEAVRVHLSAAATAAMANASATPRSVVRRARLVNARPHTPASPEGWHRR